MSATDAVQDAGSRVEGGSRWEASSIRRSWHRLQEPGERQVSACQLSVTSVVRLYVPPVVTWHVIPCRLSFCEHVCSLSKCLM